MRDRFWMIIIALATIVIAIACLVYLPDWSGHRNKGQNDREYNDSISNRARAADALAKNIALAQDFILVLEDSNRMYERALEDCRNGNYHGFNFTHGPRIDCGSQDLEILLERINYLQCKLKGYKDALYDCLLGSYHKPVIDYKPRVRRSNPCPTCPPAYQAPAYQAPAYQAPAYQAPAPVTDDGIDPALRDFAQTSKSYEPVSNPGEPVNTSIYVGTRSGPHCVSFNKEGYTQYCVSDQMCRLSPQFTGLLQKSISSGVFILESDGYWVYTDRSPAGRVTMDNLFNKLFIWSAFMGINTESTDPFEMWLPHEIVKMHGLLDQKHKATTPSVWPNGHSWKDADTSLDDEGMGWEFRDNFSFIGPTK